MATMTFSDALSGARRRGQLTGRSVSANQTNQIYTNQANTARQSQLGAQSTPQETAVTPSSNTFADYQARMAKQMEDFTRYQEEMAAYWDEMMSGLDSMNAPKPYDSQNPLQNLSQPGQTPSMGGDRTVNKPEIWAGSYTYNPGTNAYDPTYYQENFIPGDPGRTVFDPRINEYVPATNVLRWQEGVGFTMWDDATKSNQPLPSQVFGGTGVPKAPEGPFRQDPDNGGMGPGGVGAV